jgi:hypothetical protein
VHGAKTAPESLIDLVFERKLAVRDVGWLGAATAEWAECAGVSAGRCGYAEDWVDALERSRPRREGRRHIYTVEDPHVLTLVQQIFAHIAPDGSLAPDPPLKG